MIMRKRNAAIEGSSLPRIVFNTPDARHAKTYSTRAKLALIGGVLFSLLLSAVTVRAQNESNPDQINPQRGFNPWGSYDLSNIETISSTNGNLMFHIPMVSLPPGRGGSAGASVGLFYNSKTFEGQPGDIFVDPSDRVTTYNYLVPSEDAGWRYGFQFQLRLLNRMDLYPDLFYGPKCPNVRAQKIWKLKMGFPDGSTHEFRPVGFSDGFSDGYFEIRPDGYHTVCTPVGGGNYIQETLPFLTTTVTYYSVDGTYMKLDVEHDSDGIWSNNHWTLSMPDGTRVTGGDSPQRIKDRNNNYVEFQNITYNGHPASKIVDQLGRYLIVEYGSATNQDSVHMWSINNQQVTWTVKWKVIPINKTYEGTEDAPPRSFTIVSLPVVDQIILPVQAGSLTYTFGYNGTGSPSGGWGEVSSVTLPSGAQASYQYTLDGVNDLLWSEVIKNRPSRKDLIYQLQYDGGSNSTTETWLYQAFYPTGLATQSQTTGPDNGIVTEYFFPLDGTHPGWADGLVYKTDGPASVVERTWLANRPFGADRDFNPYLKTEFTSIKDAGGTPVKTAIKDFNYDKNGNVTQTTEYDWSAIRACREAPTESLQAYPVPPSLSGWPLTPTTVRLLTLQTPQPTIRTLTATRHHPACATPSNPAKGAMDRVRHSRAQNLFTTILRTAAI